MREEGLYTDRVAEALLEHVPSVDALIWPVSEILVGR